MLEPKDWRCHIGQHVATPPVAGQRESSMKTNPDHLKALRAEMLAADLQAFVIPLTDEHMSEYVGDYAGRLKWLTGFAGSAGQAIVTLTKAAIFTDGRYSIQVAEEVNADVFELQTLDADTPGRWLLEAVNEGDKVGFDPELATIAWVQATTAQLARKDAILVAVDSNPIDACWADQPAPSLATGFIQKDQHAGERSADKRARLGRELASDGADFQPITMLDSIAWLFNIRGNDVAHTPVMRSFGLLFADGSATLFAQDEKITEALRDHLGNEVSIEPLSAFYGRLADLAQKGLTARLDPGSNNAKVFATIEAVGGKIIEGRDPCILAKALKNQTEQQGSRDAHIRDGAAITEFLHWLSLEAPKGDLDELSVAAKLWNFRQRLSSGLKDSSFDTISGAGPNAALPHYRVSEESNRRLETGTLYLVDSGGQYEDGTTDITRTIAIGTPTDEMRDRYTRVLKGHIALATAQFPEGTPGIALDSHARRPMWDAGLDYDHGTGHGVGSFLAVHEGPQRIAKAGSDEPLKAGMILSNEPGYYKEGAYGIRIENLVLIQPAPKKGEREMLCFETLTFAPLDPALLDGTLLTSLERAWINQYHRNVWDKISPLVGPEVRNWLETVTRPLEEAAG